MVAFDDEAGVFFTGGTAFNVWLVFLDVKCEITYMQKSEENISVPAVAPFNAQPAPQVEAPQPTPQPVINALAPDKTVEVPKYAVCMATSPETIKEIIRAVTPSNDK